MSGRRRPPLRRAAWALPGLLALAAVSPAPAAAPGPGPLLSDTAAGPALGAGWRFAGLPRQQPPRTRLLAERVDGRLALRIEADASYGQLAHDLSGVTAPRQLSWRWRVTQPNPGSALAQRRGDDTAARVCLGFDQPESDIPFFERELLRIARSASGEPLPAATLCWAWGGTEARGTLIENPFSRRVRTIVLRSSADADGTWHEERIDVHADFIRAFGTETPSVPPATAVFVGGDADNTGARSLAFVADLQLER